MRSQHVTASLIVLSNKSLVQTQDEPEGEFGQAPAEKPSRYYGLAMMSLTAAEVHVWTAHVPQTVGADLEGTLSSTEWNRANRFHFKKDRLAYVFAHAVLRDVLSRYLHCPPRDIRFGENHFGKPFVADKSHGKPPEFNLSHAGLAVLVAVSGDRKIGIDIEEIRPIDEFRSIAKRHFTAQECAFVFGHAPEDREREFFRCWTRKEAYIKATGKGLSLPLNSVETFLNTGQLVRRLTGDTDANATHWWVDDIDAPENYVAAIAIETGIDRLGHFRWRAGS